MKAREGKREEGERVMESEERVGVRKKEGGKKEERREGEEGVQGRRSGGKRRERKKKGVWRRGKERG